MSHPVSDTMTNPKLDFLPRNLQDSLLPFQREGILYALQKKGRCLFGDEMGLGKTIQAISVAYYYKSEWPLLIVVPSSMRYPWIEELEKWLPDLQPNDVNLITSGTDIRNISKCRISLVGYGLLRNDSRTLMQSLTHQDFRVMIVDESHYLKNRKAARTKLLMPLLHQAERVLLLTGTPALARPAELFTQIDSVQKGLMGNWSQFAKRYCNAQWRQFGPQRRWDTSGASHLDELHKQLVQTIMIRREKKQVLTQLPPKRRQKVPFELADSEEKKELEKCWAQLDRVINPQSNPGDNLETIQDSGFEVKKLASQMYILTGKAKIGAICEYVKMLLENQDLKFLVFAHHKDVLTALAQTVSSYAKEHKTSLKYIRIDGDVPSSERMHLVSQFQTDGNTRVALLSILAAGTGLTLTAASQVVFAELHWTPGVLQQCEDRAHRIGQVNSIHVHYLVARGTIDEWLWSALSRKPNKESTVADINHSRAVLTIMLGKSVRGKSKVNVLSSTLNGRVQHLRMEEKDEDEVEFLKYAATWLPSNRDLQDDDSFYFGSKKTSHDIRTFFTPSQGENSKKRKRKHPSSGVTVETPPNPRTGSYASDIETFYTDDDCQDFKVVKKHRPSSELSPKELFSLEGTEADVGGCTVDNGSVEQVKSDTSLEESAEPVPVCNDIGLSCPNFADDLPEMKSNRKRRRSTKIKLEDDEKEKSRGTDMNGKNLNTSRPRKPPGKVVVRDKTCHQMQDVGHTPVLTSKHRQKQQLASKMDLSLPSGSSVQTGINGTWSCCACTFENHAELPFCEICTTPRQTRTRTLRRHPKASQSKHIEHDSGVDTSAIQTTDDCSSTQPENNDAEIVHNCANSIFESTQINKSVMRNETAESACESSDDNTLSSDSEATVGYDLPGEQSPMTKSIKDSQSSIEQSSSLSDQDLITREIEEATNCYLSQLSSKPNAAQGTWQCGEPTCRYLNTTDDEECETCWSPRPEKCSTTSQSDIPGFVTASEIHQSNKLMESASKPEVLSRTETPSDEDLASSSSQMTLDEAPTLYVSFFYCPSRHTDRIYLYDQDGTPLNCSFLAIDLQHRDLSALPHVLHSQHNMCIALRFLREWNSLNEMKRKQLRKRCELFDSPQLAFEALKQGQTYQPCNKRFITKDDLAEAARQRAETLGGRVRVIAKGRLHSKTAARGLCHHQPNHTASDDGGSSSRSSPKINTKQNALADSHTPTLKRGTFVQAVDGEGRPLCVFCGKVTATSTAVETHQRAAWDMRYCSETCKHEHSIRWKNSKYVRQQLLEVEHGICQLCGMEAQQLCNLVKDASKPQRKELMENSALSKMPTSRLNEIIRNPSSGQFWHADHIVPVAEGGGLCSLDNYRTLCVLCHDKVTAEQNTRRRNRLKAAGIPDIRSFFKP